ncbi:uncharacterized protein cp110 [Fundulus diaphanus]
MENYTEFVQLRLSKLQKNEEEEEERCRTSSASSLILFYGRPILPPLLSGKQREEMRRHRDEAQRAAANQKLQDDPRMAYIQTILHSVQLRKTPTLQEYLEETEIKAESPHPHNTSRFSASSSGAPVGTTESVSPVPVGKSKNAIFVPPKTSTTCRAFSPSAKSPQQSYCEAYLADQLDSRPGGQPCSSNAASHQSPSSGCVTWENQENATAVSGGMDFTSAEDMDHGGGFYLHNTSHTISKMPDIISHPPIDGEELERTGLESPFCSNIMGAESVCSASFHSDSVRCDPLRAEQPERSHPHSLNKEVDIPFTARPDPASRSSAGRNDGSLALSDRDGPSDNPDLERSLNLTKEVHGQKIPSKAEVEAADSQIDVVDLKHPEDSRPLSLQVLLKKSQEYRRRQRMLRNQAKSTKIHQEQPRARAEEPSLSDKENDELHHKGAVTGEGRKTKERRGSFIQSEEPAPQKSWEANPIQGQDRYVAEDGRTAARLSVEEETSLNNRMNSSQDAITSPKQMGVLIQQQPLSTKFSPVRGTFYDTPCLSSLRGGVGKNRSVPVPSLCLSPVPCKSKAAAIRVQDLSPDHQRSPPALPSAVDLTGEDDATSVFAKSSLHIDQLESNLCSLKALISDLESTVKGNLDSQADSSMHSEESSKDSETAGQDGSSGSLEDTPAAAAAAAAADGSQVEDLQQRQSFIQFKNTDEDVGPGPRTCRREDVSLTAQDRGSEIIKLSKQSLLTASKRENGNKMSAEGGSSSNKLHSICKKEQLPSKGIMSVAQQMRIPCVFRNVASKNVPQCHISLWSHLKDREGNIRTEAEDPVASPSLNQSYDVDTPSDLWFQEGSGSDPGSQGGRAQGKHLTPEGGGEDQVGVSKVKRRLLMHEGTGRAAASVVRSNPGTPKAAVRWSEGCGVQRQEQLKQVHAAQVRALQEEHRKQQEELLQVLAARYRLLQDASPCSTTGSGFGDTLTFSSLSQAPSPLSQRCRPLLAAAVKGFLTRRLLRTERVAQLVRTIRDTQQFLQAFQQRGTGRGERWSRQDVLLQERVALQLRAARYEVYDIFFSLSAREQTQLIRRDRELARERRLRRQNGHAGDCRGKSSLSAATQKSLERKRERMIQKRTAECHGGAVVRTGQKSRFSAEKPSETKRGQFIANPQRVPKSVSSSRPR